MAPGAVVVDLPEADVRPGLGPAVHAQATAAIDPAWSGFDELALLEYGGWPRVHPNAGQAPRLASGHDPVPPGELTASPSAPRAFPP